MKNLLPITTFSLILPLAASAAYNPAAFTDFWRDNDGKTIRRIPVNVMPENVFWGFGTRAFADVMKTFNPTFHVRNESQRFARAFVRFLELSNKGLHYTPADAVCAASELTFGGGCAGSVSPSWFKRILTSSFGST